MRRIAKTKPKRDGKPGKNAAIAGFTCIALAAAILLLPDGRNYTEQINWTRSSSVNSICELATLKNYYHNVAIYEKQPDQAVSILNDILFWPFNNLTKVGYKQYWLEYSGVVEMGIDASWVRIGEPDARGVVEVFVPDATVQNVYADENSFMELQEYGWFASIDGKEKDKALNDAEANMKQEAGEDKALLFRAKENAKTLLERYIVNMGKSMGRNLTVKWIE